MYRTSNVARLAGAAVLPSLLAVWGLLFLLVTGETTVTTWGLGLALLFPTSALLLGVTQNGTPPRSGTEYSVGLIVSVVALSVAYLGVAIADYSTMSAVVGFTSLELAAAAVVFALLGGTLALADLKYVKRPVTAALLEERYLDTPIDGD